MAGEEHIERINSGVKMGGIESLPHLPQPTTPEIAPVPSRSVGDTDAPSTANSCVAGGEGGRARVAEGRGGDSGVKGQHRRSPLRAELLELFERAHILCGKGAEGRREEGEMEG